MTAPTDDARIDQIVEHYRDRLAGAYGLDMLHDRAAADEVCARLVDELGHRDPWTLARMVMNLLDQPAKRDAVRMVRPSAQYLDSLGHTDEPVRHCPDPELHRGLYLAREVTWREPAAVVKAELAAAVCCWCGLVKP